MIFLTQLAQDNFQRPNENPLSQGGNWSLDSHPDPALKIASDICEATTTSVCAELYTGQTLPNDQYATLTFATTPHTGSFAIAILGIRTTDNGSSILGLPGYQLRVFSVNGPGGWVLSNMGTTIISGSQNAAAGDVWIVAAVGTTIFVLQNGVQIGSVTNAAYSSGIACLAAFASNTLQDIQYSNFACGSASTAPPAPSVYSVPDCRDYVTFPNLAINVNGTLTYTVPAHPSHSNPTDSRTTTPVSSGTYPQNNREAGVFGPGE